MSLITVIDDELCVLLIRRDQHPYSGRWQLPGGFVRIDESVDDAARRTLAEKTGISNVFVEQLYTFGDLDRDPRTRVISIAYYALVDAARLADRTPGSLLARIDVPWPGERGGPVGYELLPAAFTLLDLQRIHETILGVTVNKDSFRRRMLASGELEATGERQTGVGHRPAALYRRVAPG